MASKNIRIRDWATQNGLQNKDVIAALDAFGFPGKTASSNLPPEAMDRLVEKFNLKKSAEAPTEEKPAPAQKPAKPAPQKQDEPKKQEAAKPQPPVQPPARPRRMLPMWSRSPTPPPAPMIS